MPFRLRHSVSGLRVDWCYMGGRRLADPFFDQTVNQCFRHPANVLFQHETPMSALGELHERSVGLAPSGFIFHASRCGSTLVSQMLAALPENVVISEAGPVDAVLRSQMRNPAISEEQRVLWLRWLLNALGQRRFAAEKRFFVKFECWQVLLLPLIRRAFPDVPWIFLYRNPVEVMVSHQNRMGPQMIPGALEPALFDWDAEEVRRMTWVEYRGRVLAKILKCGLGAGPDWNGNAGSLPAVASSRLVGTSAVLEGGLRAGSGGKDGRRCPVRCQEPASALCRRYVGQGAGRHGRNPSSHPSMA